MITLRNLKNALNAGGWSAKSIARHAGMDYEAIQEIASTDPRRTREPWLKEAHALARILSPGNIRYLMGWDDLLLLPPDDLEEDMRGDLAIWRTGCDLPLSVACRLCLRFGMPDPYTLFEHIRVSKETPIVGEAWAVVASGERLHGLGGQAGCPWCIQPVAAGAPHLETCIANNLWGDRREDVKSTIDTAPTIRKPGTKQMGSFYAWGLRSVRIAAGLSKSEMSQQLGFVYAHYHRIEQGQARLTFDAAAELRKRHGWTREMLEQRPVAAGAQENAEPREWFDPDVVAPLAVSGTLTPTTTEAHGAA